MSTAKTSFPTYPASLAALDAAASFWTTAARNAADVSLWWADKWFEAPSALAAAWTSPLARTVAVKTADLAETVAKAPLVVAEDVAPVAVAAAEAAQADIEAALPEPDDLTRLVGIGPKLAIALAGRGVTSFTQISAWTEKDLAELDKALDLKGRAVRDAWVAQAKRLIAA